MVNWEAASAIAEWLGLAFILVSVGYLAVQVRQNTHTVRASTELETGRQWSDFHARVAHSPDMADIWDKGLTAPDNLTAGEKRKFIWLIAEYFFLVESLYRQRQLGFLGHDSWNQHQRAMAGLLVHPMIQSWWESGVSPYSPEFRAAANDARYSLGDVVWSYTSLSDL